MYLDTCWGQNKNSYIAAMCIVALQDPPTLKIIDHKYFLAGHTHKECDTDHNNIIKNVNFQYNIITIGSSLFVQCGKKFP